MWREEEKNREWAFMRQKLEKIFWVLALQVYQILQFPCSNLIVGNYLKFVFTVTQMDLSVVEYQLGWREREARQYIYNLWMIQFDRQAYIEDGGTLDALQ